MNQVARLRYVLLASLNHMPSKASVKARWVLVNYLCQLIDAPSNQMQLKAPSEKQERYFDELVSYEVFAKSFEQQNNCVMYCMNQSYLGSIQLTANLDFDIDSASEEAPSNMMDSRIPRIIRHLVVVNPFSAWSDVQRLVLLCVLLHCDKCGIATLGTTEIKRATGLSASTINKTLAWIRSQRVIRQTTHGFAMQQVFNRVGATHVVNISHEAWGECAVFGYFWIFQLKEARLCEMAELLEFLNQPNTSPQAPKQTTSNINSRKKLLSSVLSDNNSIRNHLRACSDVLKNNQQAMQALNTPLEQTEFTHLKNYFYINMLQTRFELLVSFFLNYETANWDLSNPMLSPLNTINSFAFKPPKYPYKKDQLDACILIQSRLMQTAYTISRSYKQMISFETIGFQFQSHRKTIFPQNTLERKAIIFYVIGASLLAPPLQHDQLTLVYQSENDDLIYSDVVSLTPDHIDLQLKWGLLSK
jgi:hypothetical protein